MVNTGSSVLLVPILACCCCHAAVQILSGPAANQTFYCTSSSHLLGPQPDPSAVPVAARLHFFQSDACDLDAVSRYEVQGKAVFVKSCSCSEDRIYYNMASRGAMAVLRRGSFQPGSDYYVKATHVQTASRTDMLYVHVEPSSFSPDQFYEDALVVIKPDPNIWLPYFRSLTWQLFLRWIPGGCFALGFPLAAIFLLRHMQNNYQRYYHQVPRTLAMRKEALMFAIDRIDLIHLALTIEIINCPMLAVFFMYGGYYSTSNLPDEIQRFFVTQLSGLTFMTTMISARAWYRSTHKQQKARTLLSKMIGNFSNTRWFVTLTAIPVVIDMFSSVLYILYIPNAYPILDFVVGGTFFSLKLFVGSMFLTQTLKFLIRVRKSAKAIDAYAENQEDSDIKMSLYFQTLFALGVGVSIAIGVLGSLVIVLEPKFFSRPQGYMTAFSLMSTGHGLETLFHIMILRPVFRSATPKPVVAQ